MGLPRKKGRSLTYEGKWMFYRSFESFEYDKHSESVVIAESPYEVTNLYICVFRRISVNTVKLVKTMRSGNRGLKFGQKRDFKTNHPFLRK